MLKAVSMGLSSNMACPNIIMALTEMTHKMEEIGELKIRIGAHMKKIKVYNWEEVTRMA